MFQEYCCRYDHLYLLYLGVLVLWTFLAFGPTLGQVRPRNFSPDAIPYTRFTCEDKITGGYYADVEGDCQLFHVCVQVSDYEVS